MRVDLHSDSKLHVILGYPIGHSLSPAIYNTLYRRYGMNIFCHTAAVPPGELAMFLQCRSHLRLSAINVTIPHKADILPLLDETDPLARSCASVNTVTVQNNQLHGYTTDAQGFALSLQDKNLSLAGQKILLLGAGGASSAIAMRAALDGAGSITILSRDEKKSASLARRVESFTSFACGFDSFDAAERQAETASMLINATPLGMSGFGSDFDDLRFINALPQNSVVYDLIYNPSETRFLRRAKQRGLTAVSGIGMLVWQAFAAFEKFYDFLPVREDIPGIFEAMRGEGIDVASD